MNFVAFDIGNVLCRVELDSFLFYLVEKELFAGYTEAYDFLEGIQVAQDLGMCDMKMGLKSLKRPLNQKILNDILEKWNSIIYPSEDMLSLIDTLLSKNYKVALLSNIGKDHGALVRERFKIFSRCIQHFSFEVGARKPSELYFQSFVLKYKWPLTTIFFDDREENIVAASDYFTSVKFNLYDYDNDNEAVEFISKTVGISDI
jgi:FMN phosphatase YigB (HAD superfamily)